MAPSEDLRAAASSPTITVCVFGWNEVGTIESTVREIVGALERTRAPYEVLVIDDGSTDGMSEAADQLAATNEHVRVVHHGQNRGVGPAYRTGFDEARGTFVTFFPADGQFPATIIQEFYARMEELDMCLGYLPSRTDTVGKVLSTAERVLYRVLVGKMPRFQGIFMIRRSVLRALPLTSEGRGWAIVMELVLRVHRGGYRVKSVPTGYRPRSVGQSKVNNWRSIQANLKQLATLRLVLAREPE